MTELIQRYPSPAQGGICMGKLPVDTVFLESEQFYGQVSVSQKNST